MTRRSFALLTLAGLLAACGASDDDGSDADTEPPTSTDGSSPAPEGPAGLAPVPVADREPGADPMLAGESITRFGYEIFASLAALRGAGDDVSISPASIALVLGMLEPGTVAAARDELHRLLTIDDPDAFHRSMNGLQQGLESRVPDPAPGDGDPGEITMRTANAGYFQPGYPFEADYLDAVGRNYGPVINELDFAADPDGAVDVINAFVAESTEGRITEPLGPGSISRDVVLALVNALFLKASWISPFDESETAPQTFTALDGATTDVEMMVGSGTTSKAGDGWIGATRDHVGRVTSQFVLPDADRFEEVAGRLGDVFDELTDAGGPGGEFRMPRFETRVNAQLKEPLRALGLTAPFDPGGLLGIADDPDLLVDTIAHETFVAYDEEGVEAAAATILLAATTSAPVEQPVPVTLERPFFYRIVDQDSGATLFLGRVMDPAAS